MKDGFSEYELHIDNLISQYKTQLEKIKLNRENKENSLVKTHTKNTSLQDNLSFQNELASNNISKNLINIPPNLPSFKNDSFEYFKREEESFNSNKRILLKEENKSPTNKVFEEKYEMFNLEQVKKSNSTNPINIDNSEFHKKLNILNEENLKLNRKINDLIKQNEKLNEVMQRNERLQSELNGLLESESKIKKELADSNARCQTLEHQKSKNFAEMEMKYSEENSKIKYNMIEMEKFYENEMKIKNQQISELTQKIDKYEKELNYNQEIINKLNFFLKKSFKFLKDELDINENEIINEKYSFNESEIDAFLIATEKYMNKLKYDNTELVKYINTKLNRNNKEEQEILPKINKLNEIINDLKMENSLLKNQINNILDEQISRTEKSSYREKYKNDYSVEYKKNSRKKKVSTESLEKNSSSYNPSRAITPLKILGSKNHKSKLSKYVEDLQSNYDSEVSSTREAYNCNRSKISEFSQKEKLNSIEHENNKIISTPNNYNLIPFYKEREKEFQIKISSPKITRTISKEVNTKIYSTNKPNEFLNTKSSKALNETRDFTISNDLNHFEGLKMRIKDLENKLIEINKDDKEKQIIDSIREYRNRNITSPENKKFY